MQRCKLATSFLFLLALIAGSGCRHLSEWRSNGWKVGPDYVRPDAPTNAEWTALEIEPDSFDSSASPNERWWSVFQDPILEQLISDAYQNNRDVKSAVYRVVQANQQRLVTAGNIMPQSQTGTASFARNQSSGSTAIFPGIERITSTWSSNLSLAWELDFWGKIRRSIIAADASLDASIENLDTVLITLVADVASTYYELRSIEKRLEFAHSNVAIQKETLRINSVKKSVGEISSLDVEQAKVNLLQTQASIPQLELSHRQLQNRLSILVGVPPTNFDEFLGTREFPEFYGQVVVGIPADLMRRRPDIRSAERQLAAQSEQIGIAKADLFPTLSLTGSLSLGARQFDDLFSAQSMGGVFNPSAQWNILNYGRIVNRIKAEGAQYLELVSTYQDAVLTAQQEAENAMAGFVLSGRRQKLLEEAVDSAKRAVDVSTKRWLAGEVEYNQVFTVEANLFSLQDQMVQAKLQTVQNLIQLYRALGGGWEIRNQFECLPGIEFCNDPTGYDRKCMPPLCNEVCHE